ncbi:MAG: IS256 family transposase [Methanobacteriota archaeon]
MHQPETPNETSRKKRKIPKKVLDDLDELLREWGGSQAVTGKDGLLQALTGALIERALGEELTYHLDYEHGEEPPEEQANRRNGITKKTVRTNHGPVELDVPRDREGSFAPVIVPKHVRHFNGFDDKIVSMYARGMSTRDIQAHLKEIYGTDVAADLVTRVTDGVLQDVHAWQNRALEPVYPIVYLDALVTKIRDTGVVQNKSVYLAVGVTPDGEKDVLGMWVQATEGAKFWLSILEELKARGVQDVLVLCADGLTGLPEAVEAAFPKTIFQTCIVHMIRSSTRYVPWKDRKRVCAALRTIYTAPNEAAARRALDAFEAEYGREYPTIAKAWRARWTEITPFLAFPPEIRRAVYTTNAIEALNRHVRKALKTKGHMPNEDAALKLIYLNVQTASRWKRPPQYWLRARQQFVIYFEGRFPQ